MTTRLRLLLVEDSVDDAELIAYELRRSGYDLLWRRVDTEAGLTAALDGQSWDVVTCDYMLPGYSAAAALHRIRAADGEVPIIVVSGEVGEEIAVGVMQAGANDFVSKGRLSRLVPAIERGLREADERRAHRRVESALRASQEQLRIAMIAARMTAWEWDLATDRVTCSEEVGPVFGYPPGERQFSHEMLVGTIHPSERARVVAARARAIEGGGEYAVEYRGTSPDGSVRWIAHRGAVIRDASGRPVKLAGVAMDVTDRRQAEEDRALLNAALEQAAESIVITDADGRIVYVNAACERMTGYQRAELCGQTLAMLQDVDPAPAAGLWRGTVVQRKKDGSLYEVEATISPLSDASGRVINYVNVARLTRAA